MSIITCIVVAIVAGFIVFIKTLNAEKNANHPQINCKEADKLVDSKTDDNIHNTQVVKSTETWIDEYGVVFSADKKKLIKAPKELKEYIIPEGTVSIENRAFKSSQIEYVIIPNSVTRIKFGAFAWCDKLVVEIPDNVKKIDNEAFLFVKEVHCYGPLKEKGPWGAEKFVTRKAEESKVTSNHVPLKDDGKWGEIPWGPGNPRNGYEFYYKGGLLNGKPHGYGTIYHCSMDPYHDDEIVESGRWKYGRRCYNPNEIDMRDLTDEELHDIMHDRL